MEAMVKNFLIAVLVTAALAVGAWGQTAPVNANTLDGIAPGYAVKAIGGLKIDVASGAIFCSGTWVTWLESTLLVTNSTTNYVYLNTASSCVPAVKTSAFTVADVPLAIVVAAGGQVTSVIERRGLIVVPPSATGNMPSGSGNKFLATPADGSSGPAALRAQVRADIVTITPNVVTKTISYLASVTDDVVLWNGAMDGSAGITFDTGSAPVGKIWTVKVIQADGSGPLNINTGNAAEWAGNPQIFTKPGGTSSGGSVQVQWDGAALWVLFYNQ
jgi:hypothetical protein